MIAHKNLSVIGTSHIAQQSLDEIKAFIEKEKPEIVALELDRRRLGALLQKKKRKANPMAVFKVGLNGFIFSLLGAWGERKLGDMVGVSPGSEMVKAYRLAKKHGAKVALVDQDIEITLQRFSKQITFKERWRFFYDVVMGVVFKKEVVKIDLTKVPSDQMIQHLLGKVRKRYPAFYRVLVTERNEVLATNLKNIMAHHPTEKILAVVGAGHEKELMRLVQQSDEPTYSFSVTI